MVPAIVTQAAIESEMDAISAWADRWGWDVRYDHAAQRGVAVATHPAVEAKVAFYFDTEGYPEVPPAWWCGPVVTGEPEAEDGAARTQDLLSLAAVAGHYPSPASEPIVGLTGSIFHPQPVMCAPWNRLAYGHYGGPHQDWGAMTGWKNAGGDYTQAHSIADMLSTLRLHLRYSPGMNAA
jgi:hypothetical protein